jgi:hypothetical protein
MGSIGLSKRGAKAMDEIIEKLGIVRVAMIEAGVAMSYYNGIDTEIVEKSKEILSGTMMIGTWIEYLGGIEK